MAFVERRVAMPAITLNVREAGQGHPIIFLHGITANASVWDPVLNRLQDSFRVIAVDQRGHGKSDKPAYGYDAESFAQDSLDLIETLRVGPATIVGHSLGARNGIVAAVRSPEAVAGVVAIDFTPFIEHEVMEALEARVKGGDRAFASRTEIREYLASRYPLMPPDALDRRARNGYIEHGDKYFPLASANAMAATAKGLYEDLEPAMAAVRTPVLLVRGGKSKLVSEAAFERTKSLRPDLPTMIVSDADHYVPEEAPEIIADVVRRFACNF